MMLARLAAVVNMFVIAVALLQPAYATESLEDRHKRQAEDAANAVNNANQAMKDKNYDLVITLLTKALDSKGVNSDNIGTPISCGVSRIR